jgi:hypothetical protein
VTVILQTDDRKTPLLVFTTSVFSLQLKLWRFRLPILEADFFAGGKPETDATMHRVESIDRISTDEST